MNEDFVCFELAKKLKEKGYPQKPDHMSRMPYYEYDDVTNYASLCNEIVWHMSTEPRDNIFAAPAIHKVLKWLREEKNTLLSPNPSYFKEDCCLGWDCDVWFCGNYNHNFVDCKTYEQAALAGIEYVLDNLI